MDASRFDRLASSLATTSRRRLLGGLAATAEHTSPRNPDVAIATKRGKQLKRNQFGCVNVGGKCRGRDAACCSGICQGQRPRKGKRDKSRCEAHDADVCQPGQTPAICGGTIVPCTTTDGDPGVCLTTTGQAGYCATVTVGVACQKDAKCRAFTMNPRAACTRCATAPAGAVCALF